ncbi:MAG: hypothetical protein K2L37_06965, partial [Lactobacillus sp.]|nr:hypothetical protein [Lactobacillus sp.]
MTLMQALNVKLFFVPFSQPMRPDEKTPFPFLYPVLLICSTAAPYQNLFGFGRSSDKLHSLG